MQRSFERDLIEHCAPTLAGLKSANLFHLRTAQKEELLQSMACWQPVLQARGLTLLLLKETPQANSFLIYLYRKTKLEEELMQAETQRFLQQEGYALCNTCEGYLAQLQERLYLQKEFPHEIGLFLGYPLQDVVGFIAHKGKNFTHCGHWKTYGDASEARVTFERFQHCTQTYLRCFCNGISIQRLAVAV